MSSNVFNDLSNSDILFINILNAIYNDNLRMIHHLMDHNNEITSTLINIMNNRRRTNLRPTNRNRNNGENQRRYYIENLPYLDNIEIILPTTTTERNNIFTRAATNRAPSSNSNSNLNMNSFSRLLNSFLEPVNITPTREQIENSTRNITYGDILDPINNSCPISLEQFTDSSTVTMIRQCRHIFNTNSLMAWFNSNCKCPVCRYDIRDYRANNNSNTSNNTGFGNTNETNANSVNNTSNNNIDNQYVRDDDHDDDDDDENENNDIVERNNSDVRSQQNERTEDTSTNRNIRHNINNIRYNTNNSSNNSTINNSVNNILENLFNEAINDLSGNSIEYILDNNSLFTLLYPLTRRGNDSRR
jgi:hypothetical protein